MEEKINKASLLVRTISTVDPHIVEENENLTPMMKSTDLKNKYLPRNKVILLIIVTVFVCLLLAAIVSFAAFGYLSVKHSSEIEKFTPPNIIFILVDDLGFNDVSWNNPMVQTPFLEKLARKGSILNQYYVQPMCSPSRSSLLTGIHAYKLGSQHRVLFPRSPYCEAQEQTLLPEILKKQGYNTHILGKWHMGSCALNCTPTRRGFDTFYGHYQGFISHYDHEIAGGYDWQDDESVDISCKGKYSTDLITERSMQIVQNHDVDTPIFLYLSYSAVHTPIESPKEFSDKYLDLTDNAQRREYLGMMSAIDDSVEKIVKKMEERKMMDNTVIVFSSDNGAQAYVGSNYPLRGAKGGIYEGGVRVPAFFYSTNLKNSGRISNDLFHITDWYPTLLSIASDNKLMHSNVDGINMESALMDGTKGKREEIMLHIDTYPHHTYGKAAFRKGDFKLIIGYPGLYDGWQQYTSLNFSQNLDLLNKNYNLSTIHRNPAKEEDFIYKSNYNFDFSAIIAYSKEAGHFEQLYNLRVDPEEKVNIANLYPQKVEELKEIISKEYKHVAPINLSKFRDSPLADPKNYNGTWTYGWC